MTDDEYDYYFADRLSYHRAMLHAKLRASDADTVEKVDSMIGAKLFGSEEWKALIVGTARGEHSFDALQAQVVIELAEVEAHKDAEKYEEQLKRVNVENIADRMLGDAFFLGKK